MDVAQQTIAETPRSSYISAHRFNSPEEEYGNMVEGECKPSVRKGR